MHAKQISAVALFGGLVGIAFAPCALVDTVAAEPLAACSEHSSCALTDSIDVSLLPQDPAPLARMRSENPEFASSGGRSDPLDEWRAKEPSDASNDLASYRGERGRPSRLDFGVRLVVATVVIVLAVVFLTGFLRIFH